MLMGTEGRAWRKEPDWSATFLGTYPDAGSHQHLPTWRFPVTVDRVHTQQSWGARHNLVPCLGFSFSPAPTRDRWISCNPKTDLEGMS